MEKLCPKCRCVGEFYRHRGRKDGYQYVCKSCMRGHVKDWEKAHPGRKEEIKHKYDLCTLETKLAYQRQYRMDHPDQVRNLYRKAAHVRNARMKGVFVEAVDPQVVYEMHGGICGICKDFVAYEDFEVDHITPIAKGGLHAYINVQPAHRFCNRSKKDRLEVVPLAASR